MIYVQRTIFSPSGGELQKDRFALAKLNSRVGGAGVNNKVIYDLKKRRKSEVQYSDGSYVVFEVVPPNEKEIKKAVLEREKS